MKLMGQEREEPETQAATFSVPLRLISQGFVVVICCFYLRIRLGC